LSASTSPLGDRPARSRRGEHRVDGLIFGEAVRRLGASRAAVLGSFTPVVAPLLGMPLLGEFPAQATWLSIIGVSVGVVLASGGFSRGPAPDRATMN